jgi:hypothetical protein
MLVAVNIASSKRCLFSLTSLAITTDSTFPIELWIDAELDGSDGDEITVSFNHGVETVAGARGLTVSSADVM